MPYHVDNKSSSPDRPDDRPDSFTPKIQNTYCSPLGPVPHSSSSARTPLRGRVSIRHGETPSAGMHSAAEVVPELECKLSVSTNSCGIEGAQVSHGGPSSSSAARTIRGPACGTAGSQTRCGSTLARMEGLQKGTRGQDHAVRILIILTHGVEA